MIDLYDYSLITVFLVGLAFILVAGEAGWQLSVRSGGQGSGNISTLESALLGLLALMISFTFAMALSRFEARRDAVLNEANTIGTTALRARLLPEPHRAESMKLLREYVKIRLEVYDNHRTLAEVGPVIERSNQIQEALWQQAKAMAANDKSLIPTGLFIQSLNEMFDNQAKRLGALRNRVPNMVLIGLFGIAAVAAGFVGYASALDPKRTRWPANITAALVATVILLILDLDRPASGFITNNQQAMRDVASSIAAFPD